jgi:hypothetical protein
MARLQFSGELLHPAVKASICFRSLAIGSSYLRYHGQNSLVHAVFVEKAALRNKEVVSTVPAPFLQESALQFCNLDSPARKLQTRSAQSNQPLSVAFCHNRNVSAALTKVIRVSIE